MVEDEEDMDNICLEITKRYNFYRSHQSLGYKTPIEYYPICIGPAQYIDFQKKRIINITYKINLKSGSKLWEISLMCII